MTIHECLWAAVLMFAAVHFAIIAVYTVKVERAVICCVLAALAFAGAVAAIQPRIVAFKFIALLALIVGVDLAIVRCKVLKHFGARRFLHGRWWRIVPVAMEFAAAAVLLALHLCSHLAAERFFDRLEREVGEFKNSDAAAVRLTIPAPKGSHLLLLSPYASAAEPDLPAVVNSRLKEIAYSVDYSTHLVLVDRWGRIFVRKCGRYGNKSLLRWDEGSGVIRVGVVGNGREPNFLQ